MSRSGFLPFISMLALGFPLVVYAECMGPYPPSMVKQFNQNCSKDAPQTLPFCSCIIDELQKNIPLADFIEIGNSPAGLSNEPRFIKASKKCSPQLSSAPAGSSGGSPSPGSPATGASPAAAR